MEPFPKRFRSEIDGPASNTVLPEQQQQPQDWGGIQQGSGGGSTGRFRHVSTEGRDVGQQAFSSAGKPKPCMKFFSTSGCPFGDTCHFLHYVPGGVSALGLVSVVSLSAASVSASQRKSAGPVGDQSATVNGYKTKLCNRFNTAEGCRFGDRCHFAHGESDLRPSSNLSRGNRRAMTDGLMGTAPPGFNNEGFSSSNPIGYSSPLGNISNFNSQVYGEPNQSGVAGNNDISVTYPGGPASGNVQVY